jgi:hypothetical protein
MHLLVKWSVNKVMGLIQYSYVFIFKLQIQLVPIKTYAVAQLVEAMCYKPEGRGFDSRLCHWNFSLT